MACGFPLRREAAGMEDRATWYLRLDSDGEAASRTRSSALVAAGRRLALAALLCAVAGLVACQWPSAQGPALRGAAVLAAGEPTTGLETKPPLAGETPFNGSDFPRTHPIVYKILGLYLLVGVYSLMMKALVLRYTRQPLRGGGLGAGKWLDADGELPPVLKMLEAMRPEDRIDGAEVEKRLKYSSLLDLLPRTSDVVFEDPSARAPLRHGDLAAQIRNLDLLGIGLGPEDRVACLIPNGPEAAVFLMCCFAKCTVVPLNPTSTQQEIVADAKRVRAKALVAHRDYIENPKQRSDLTSASADLSVPLFDLGPDKDTVGKFALQHVKGTQLPSPSWSHRLLSSADDTSLMLFTSGTSGSKKCVPYTLNTLVVGASCIISSWELRPSDKVCNMMPLFHVGGITRNLLSPVLSGGSAILCGSFDPSLFWDIVLLRNGAVSWYYAGPVMHQMILDEFKKRGLSRYNFRFIANAAGGLLPSLALAMRASYECTVLPGYGMTECMPISAPPLDYKLDREGTSGRRVGPQLKVLDDEGKSVPVGVVGNIAVKGPPVFHGYEGDEEATREAFFPGGWFNTGDLGCLDQEGYLYITGRSKEVINRGGEIISPFEVEECIQSNPRVKSVIAFSVPHQVLDEAIGVAVVLEENVPKLSLRSVQQWCKQSLTFAKWPQVLVVMPALPQNHANKPLRVKLAQRLELEAFWGSPMVDGMPEASRTFLADCPAKGASLTEPIPNVRMLHLDFDVLGRRLQKAGEDLGVQESVVAEAGSDGRLCACVTPEGVDTNELLGRIRGSWDDWEIPLIITALPELPRSGPGQPVDTVRLGRLLEVLDPDHVGPSNRTEEVIQRLWEKCLDKPRISVDADFFDLGGTSLLVGPLALAIEEELKVGITAVDFFNASTIQALASLVMTRKGSDDSTAATLSGAGGSDCSLSSTSDSCPISTERSWGNTHPLMLGAQMVPFFVVKPALRCISWAIFVNLFVWTASFFEKRCLESLVIALVFSWLIMNVACPLLFIMAKWSIVGEYQEGQFPLFGSSYLKRWFVNQLEHTLGRGVFEWNLPLFYKLLGAHIGAGVKISADVKISEYDLVTIESGVALDCCTIRPFTLNPNETFSLASIFIGEGSSVCAKSTIAGGANLISATNVGPLSSSHELEDSRVENRMACRVLRQEPPLWLKAVCGFPILLLQKVVSLTPVLLLMEHMTTSSWYNGRLSSVHDGLAYICTPERMLYIVAFLVARKTITPCLALSVAIITKRYIIGTFTATSELEEPDRSDWELFRTWLLGRMIPDSHLCGVTKLLGRHYEAVSTLYRMLGVKVGKHVYWPGSGVRFQEPDLVDIGDYVVFGSRSLFLTSDAEHRRQPIRLEAGCNVSDRCVLLPGTTVKCGAVFGSGALSKQGATYHAGTYVGSRSNECVLLKKANGLPQEPTDSPYSRAFTNRGAMPYFMLPESVHIIWSTICIAAAAVLARLPLVLALLLAHVRFKGDWFVASPWELFTTISAFIFCMYPLVFVWVLCLDISSKWLFMGRRRPGSHAWDTTSYCQRWQLYLSVAPLRGFAGEGCLDHFRGTQFLVWYFRALGASIGKNVCLYPNGADPMMTEPEMVTIQDGACIDDASLIAHLNTQGVFTINRLKVGERCVMRSFTRLQQSAVMEPRSVLLEHTLVLPADSVKANEWRQGWPAGQGRIVDGSLLRA